MDTFSFHKSKTLFSETAICWTEKDKSANSIDKSHFSNLYFSTTGWFIFASKLSLDSFKILLVYEPKTVTEVVPGIKNPVVQKSKENSFNTDLSRFLNQISL